jgi:hypothetical protein
VQRKRTINEIRKTKQTASPNPKTPDWIHPVFMPPLLRKQKKKGKSKNPLMQRQ